MSLPSLLSRCLRRGVFSCSWNFYAPNYHTFALKRDGGPHSSRGNAVNTAACWLERKRFRQKKSPWENSENKKSGEKGFAVLSSSFSLSSSSCSFFVALKSHYKLINLWRRKWKERKSFKLVWQNLLFVALQRKEKKGKKKFASDERLRIIQIETVTMKKKNSNPLKWNIKLKTSSHSQEPNTNYISAKWSSKLNSKNLFASLSRQSLAGMWLKCTRHRTEKLHFKGNIKDEIPSKRSFNQRMHIEV